MSELIPVEGCEWDDFPEVIRAQAWKEAHRLKHQTERWVEFEVSARHLGLRRNPCMVARWEVLRMCGITTLCGPRLYWKPENVLDIRHELAELLAKRSKRKRRQLKQL